MRTLRAFFIRLFARNSEREFDAELDSHLAMHIDDNLRAGMSPAEARRSALLKLGGVEPVKEAMRDRSRVLWLDATWQDLRYTLRGLRRSPGFAATAILSLALGIGASVAIFTVVDNVLLRPLPYRDPSRLVMVWESVRGDLATHALEANRNMAAPANYFDWKAQSDVFETIAAFIDGTSVLTDGDRAEELKKQAVSADLLPMLGVNPSRGRLFTAAEDRPGITDTVIISDRIWRNWFNRDEGIIGRKVQVNSRPRTIIGVLPAGFYFRNRATDLWEPLGLDPGENYRQTSGRFIWCAARMKPGVTRDRAQAQMAAIAHRLETAYPAFNKNWSVNVELLRDSLVSNVRQSMLVLLAAVSLLLAVACANVASLLLARYNSRRREMALRGALGADRWRVARQLLTESVVLGMAGGLLGLVFARWGVIGLLSLAPREITRTAEISFDLRIVFFSLALSVLTGVIFGLAPALVASRTDLVPALREDHRSSSGSGLRLRSWIVAAEVALSVVLLAGAGLLFRSLIGLQSVDPGLNPGKVLTFRISVPNARYQAPAGRVQFFARAIEEIGRLPGVRSASAVSYLPFNGLAAATKVGIQGRPPSRPGEDLIATIRTVAPGYFSTMGIPLKRGRDFTAADNTIDSPYRFIVNEAFVKRYLAGEEPIGKQINAWMDRDNPYGEIIGVTGDVKEGSLDSEPAPTVYYVHAHLNYSAMVVVVRTEADPIAIAEPARRIVQSIDRAQPIAEIRTMDEIVGETFSRQRFAAILLSAFSIGSMLLAGVGIYGVLAYSVTERTREIGVRLALGAEPGRIVALVAGGAARLVFGGALAGAIGALALSGLIRTILFGVGPRDPVSFILAPAAIVGIALIAAIVPARRASRLSPMEALRVD